MINRQHIQSLTESVGVERETLELQEVSDGSRKNLDLVPGQIRGPQVTGEALQLLWKLNHKQRVIVSGCGSAHSDGANTLTSSRPFPVSWNTPVFWEVSR